MPARTPEERRAIARIAAHTRWAREPDRTAATAPARLAAAAKWERQVDPNNELSPQERAKRADNAMRAHMGQMRRRRTT